MNDIFQQLYALLLIEIRLAAFLSVSFFFRPEWVPRRLMMGISLVLSLFVLYIPTNSVLPNIEQGIGFVLLTFQQALLGAITALLVNFFVEFFVGFGQIVSMQAGLGFVNFFVPRVGNISPMTQFFMILATVVFFSINGHLVMFNLLIDSIQVMPKIPKQFNAEILHRILLFSGIIFSGSVMLSLAVMFSIMLSNFTLAILTKFSPQLNIFSIGINVSLIICFLVIYVSFDVILDDGNILFKQLIEFVGQLPL